MVVLCLASCSWGFALNVSTPKGEVGKDYDGKITAVSSNDKSFSRNTQVTYGIKNIIVKEKVNGVEKPKRYQVQLKTTDGKTILYKSLSDLGLELSSGGTYGAKITGIPKQPGKYVFSLLSQEQILVLSQQRL